MINAERYKNLLKALFMIKHKCKYHLLKSVDIIFYPPLDPFWCRYVRADTTLSGPIRLSERSYSESHNRTEPGFLLITS